MQRRKTILCATATLLAGSWCCLATVRYVDVNNATPTPPYTNWASAAGTIQQAVDVAFAGDQVLVTNGIYQTGGKATQLSGETTNRIAVTKAVAIQSVNGPEFTVIQGYQEPVTTNGPAAIRCVYLINGASLSGFTLTNGGGDMGGGVFSYGGTVSNCILIANSGNYGGGVNGNLILNNCKLTANTAFEGGGAYGGILNNCTLTGNSAVFGGGASSSTINNCAVTGNSAYDGGGAYSSTLNNCTVTGNSAWSGSGGVSPPSTLTNCIVYYNTSPTRANYDDSWGGTLNYCCTTPLPKNGFGNLAVEPQLASASHLSFSSPCLAQGAYAAVTGWDIDAEAWANPPSIGCDEYFSGSITGDLSLSISASYTNVVEGFSVDLQASISGRVNASRWEFGDGAVVSNRPFASHAWTAAGSYPVILRAYNETHPDGMTATVIVHAVSQPVHYVALNNSSPVAPYTSWSTAATNIQDAVDAASLPGALVMVTNGLYRTGGKPVYEVFTNRVTVNKPLIVQSVNGPRFTIIQGHQVPLVDGGPNSDSAIRCVYLADGASLIGFTLTNGATAINSDFFGRGINGGGLWAESANAVVSNCIITGNSAYYGGGVYGATLNNCSLTTNSATYGGGAAFSRLNFCTFTNNFGYYGGGAWNSILNNCTLTGNSVGGYGTQAAGGGAYGGALTNCTLIANSTTNSGGGAFEATLYNCTMSGNSAWRGGGATGGNLYNCTLAGNWASDRGGGVYLGTLANCTLQDNSAHYGGGASASWLNNCSLIANSAEFGGGASEVTLNRCTLAGNWANWAGGIYGGSLNNCKITDNWAFWAGGTYASSLNNCTLTGNSADYAGGAYSSALNNCIVFFNTATIGENYLNSTFNYCCTMPWPGGGLGNITVDPQFVDIVSGNLRLQSNSPCINSGRNNSAPSGYDLDGDARIAGGTVDIGSYEFQSPASVLSYAWAQQHGLPTDGSVDFTDADSDRLNNWQEWIAGTAPTDPTSALRLLNPARSASGITVTWESVSNRTYFLERATTLGGTSSFALLTNNISGQSGTTHYTDINALGPGPFFYRVGIEQ